MTVQNFLNKLWEEDPGYFRLKHSCKTVIAILLIGIVAYPAPMLVKLFAALSAGFSMQAIVGDTRRAQVKFILLAFPAYFLCFMFGYLSQANDLLSSGLLVVLGFLAVYLKKYGPAFNFAPVNAWVFAFLGIILPITVQNQWLVFGSVILGFIISALIFLFLFPELKSKLFYSNINKFFKEYSLILQWLAHILIHKIDLEQFQLNRENYKNYLFRLTVVNGDISQNIASSAKGSIARMYPIYVKQYALAKVLSLIMEAFATLVMQNKSLTDNVRSHLFTVFAIYATAISNIDVKHSHSNYQQVLNTLVIMEKYLEDFQELILLSVLTEQQPMIPLINLNLGLRLIFNNIKSMGQMDEK